MATKTDSKTILRNLADASIPMTNDEVKQAWDLLAKRQRALAVRATQAFKVNDAVEFAGPRGVTHRGTVMRINEKTVSVRVPHPLHGHVNWKVSGTLLKHAQANGKAPSKGASAEQVGRIEDC